jgi:hypothetical protein
LWLVLLCGTAMATIPICTARAAPKKGSPMSYGEARSFLARHTNLIELTNETGARVAVAPDWQGRVMTSTCAGLEGPSFGFVNRAFIEGGQADLRFNNYGAEERMWLCPEGGQFSLWFKPGAKQALENWYTPPALNEGAWKVISAPSAKTVRMATHMEFQNTSATPFSIDVTRDVSLLRSEELGRLFGPWLVGATGRPDVKTVAYETMNQVTNRGAEFSKQKGLISIWILGMMNAGPRTVIIVPYKPGIISELGPVVKSDYFGPILPDRLRITPEAVLFQADSQFRSKIGISQQRARNVLGSIDFEKGVLTLVNFTMPDDPTKSDYLNNMWQVPQAKPYTGDVANAYNDGPNDLGKQMGAFYEIESVSPALVLKPGASLVHRHRTVHIQADAVTLAKLAKEILGVDLETIRRTMAP